MSSRWLRNSFIYLLILVAVIAIVVSFFRNGDSTKNMTFSDVIANGREGKLKSIEVSGQSLTVELKNEGKAEHNFSISGQNIDMNLEPDKSATVTVTVPASGNVQFFCKIHQTRGMQGAIFTKAGTATKTKATSSSTRPHGY